MSIRKFLNLFVSFAVMTSMLLGATYLPVSAKTDAAPAQANTPAQIIPTDETKVPHYYGPYSNYANSPFTVPNVSVAISGNGQGAEATATVGANGAITAVQVTNPGSGYSSANVDFSSTNVLAAGAVGTATVDLTGIVSSVTLGLAGSGYSNPVVTLTGGGATTQASVTAYGGVDQVILIDGGIGYIAPTAEFDLPDDPAGTQAKGTPVIDANGTITSITINQAGSGYANAPHIIIRDGTPFAPLNHAALLKETAQQMMNSGDGSISILAVTAVATAKSTLTLQSFKVDSFGSGYTSVPTATITDQPGAGTGATATAVITTSGAVTAISVTTPGSGYISTGGIQKFQDGLPMLCDPVSGCTDTNLGQHIPLAVPDTTTFPDDPNTPENEATDYYVIALVQHREQLSSSLPLQGTLLREYVQLQTPANANETWNKHILLRTDLVDGTDQAVLMPDGVTQAIAVDDPHYLGPIIQATKDHAIRVVFYNLLPTGKQGDLFIPVDTSFMGAGMGPMDMMTPVPNGNTVIDGIRNPMCGEADRNGMMRLNCYAETRATLHLHGGITPWISDGAPHQWITPANEQTGWPQGVAVRPVPDMMGANLPAGVPECSADNDGCMTFYYTNQQSARLMFYHDHAWGITRLNVYVGEAAGYIIRDATEQALIDSGLLPSGSSEIPLIIQDRTIVPSIDQMKAQDPTWDYTRWGKYGDFWYEHVYMPAQNPNDPSGMSSFGRWFYGPWFWPPVTPEFGPIANPYYNMDPKGPDTIKGTPDDWTSALVVPCSLDNPNTWQYQTEPFCEPPLIPGTPNNSAGMEQFNDTPLVNGTIYPTTTVDPKSYRLRILNAANDRFWNLQWYVADPNSASTSLNWTGVDQIGGTEVALNPVEVAAALTDPSINPNPLTSIIDVATGLTVDLNGPDWIQIGSEGGFLPAPTVVDGQQVTTYITDPTRFDVGNVDKHSMLLGPAERADVIVDFSQFAGKTLILYNDAPAAFPARIPCYDYYTGAPDLSPSCSSGTLPGYGPNTRTIMQVKVANTTPAPVYNLGALNAAFRHHVDGTGVFESGQNPIIVGQAGYNSAYGTNFAASGDCTNPTSTIPCDGFARIAQQGGEQFTFDTLSGIAANTKKQVKIEPKALHDEMNSSNFEPFGRMSGNIGVEVVPADPVLQNVVLLPFVNPPTEIFDGTNLPRTDTITPIGTMADGTQIWKFTHNGVDSHPIHFHLYDVQLINRVTWDNIIIPPEASELGWKDTVRMSPLEDTIVALRPIIPILPWEIPNSIRRLNPMMPLLDTTMFNPTDINGVNKPIFNSLVNFGWEYMMHCHILSHEEMDMMRPVLVAMPPLAPDALTYAFTGSGSNTRVVLTWNDNSITETAFVVQRSDDNITWTDLTTMVSPLDQPNTHRVGLTYTDATYNVNTNYYYRVVAQNTVGYGGDYPGLTVQSMTASLFVTAPVKAPTALSATIQSGTQVRLTWTDNATNETGFVIMRSVNGAAFTQLATPGAFNGTGLVTYIDNTVSAGSGTGNTYAYKVAAVLVSAISTYSNIATVTLALPLAPSNLTATPVRRENHERVTLKWKDLATNETGYTIQWSSTPAFTTIAGTVNTGPNATKYITGNIARQTWYFRIRANNGIGSSAWVTTGAIAAAEIGTEALPVDLSFFDGFDNMLNAWTGHFGTVQTSGLAAMGSVAGSGLEATGSPAYVFDQSVPLSSHFVSFYFNPKDAITGVNPVDIYTGLNAGAVNIFGIQYQHTDALAVYQLRAWVLTDTDVIDYSAWASIDNVEQRLTLDWQSALLSTLNLNVEINAVSNLVGTLDADTSLNQAVEVRLGPSTVNADYSGTMYFDEYDSLSTPKSISFDIYLPVLMK